MTFLLLILGFAILMKGAHLLIDGASSIARRLRVSDLAIGMTVVAFGTSAPELFVNIVSSIRGNSGIAVGNVLGSNIANIFLILGVCAIIRPLAVGRGTVWKEIPFCFLSAALLYALADGFSSSAAHILTRMDGWIFLVFFAGFMTYAFSIARKGVIPFGPVEHKSYPLGKSVLFVLAGLVGLNVGGYLIVDNAVALAIRLGLIETLIGLTIVAVGTALPELAASIVAVRKGNLDLAIGNIAGSYIFNILFVLGITALIRPLPFLSGNMLDIGVVLLSSFMLFIFMFLGKRCTLDRWQGVLFVLAYASYMVFVIIRK